MIVEKYPEPINSPEAGHVYRVDEFGNQIRMEHEIWLHMGREVPRGYEVFHKNGHTFDNRRPNLSLRPIDARKFSLGIFPTQEENTMARNILQIILNSDNAKLEEATPTEPILFWHVVRALQNQGVSMRQPDIEIYKADCKRILHLEF
jgi:hypothetical protein